MPALLITLYVLIHFTSQQNCEVPIAILILTDELHNYSNYKIGEPDLGTCKWLLTTYAYHFLDTTGE